MIFSENWQETVTRIEVSSFNLNDLSVKLVAAAISNLSKTLEMLLVHSGLTLTRIKRK